MLLDFGYVYVDTWCVEEGVVEVTATLKFTRPCLGNVRRTDYDRMQRDPEGCVIFMPTWWRAALAQAAKAINRYYKYVDLIHPGLVVEGTLTKIKRWYGAKKYKVHEGFSVGATVQASFLLPNDLSLNAFAELLEATGLYIGMSPYGWKDKYGLFSVVSVTPANRRSNVRLEAGDNGPEKKEALKHDSDNPKGGQPAEDPAGVSGHPRAGADVQAAPSARGERQNDALRDDEAVRGEGKV